MNAGRRARQKHNRSSGGGHTVTSHKQEPDPDHPGKMRAGCARTAGIFRSPASFSCRPGGLT